MLTLFKALVLSRLDYGSQLWSPHKICQINQIEKIQRAFTKHITGMYDLPYTKRLKMLNRYAHALRLAIGLHGAKKFNPIVKNKHYQISSGVRASLLVYKNLNYFQEKKMMLTMVGTL